MISSDSSKDINVLLGYEIDRVEKLGADQEALVSYMANNASVDPAADALQLDAPGEVRLWEKLYALAQKLPGLKDEERERFEVYIAEKRRVAGDFDGSTKLYAAASSHSKDSYHLRQYAQEIDKNKKLKGLVGPGAPPLLREYFLLRPGSYDSDLQRLGEPASQKRLASSVASSREIGEGHRILLGDLPAWRKLGMGLGSSLATGPRTSALRADEIRYEGWEDKPPSVPNILVTGLRGRRFTVRGTIDQGAAPPDFGVKARSPKGGGEVGVAFAITRIVPDGGIVRGAPPVTIAYAALVGDDRVRLVKIERDGEHKIHLTDLAQADVGAPRAPRRSLEVKVEPGTVSVTVDGKRAQLPWKPDGEGEGFAGLIFAGSGYASFSKPTIEVGR